MLLFDLLVVLLCVCLLEPESRVHLWHQHTLTSCRVMYVLASLLLLRALSMPSRPPDYPLATCIEQLNKPPPPSSHPAGLPHKWQESPNTIAVSEAPPRYLVISPRQPGKTNAPLPSSAPPHFPPLSSLIIRPHAPRATAPQTFSTAQDGRPGGATGALCLTAVAGWRAGGRAQLLPWLPWLPMAFRGFSRLFGAATGCYRRLGRC